METLTAQTTQRSGGLLAEARTALHKAQAEFDAACRAYEHSHSRDAWAAWIAANDKLLRIRKQCQQAYQLATGRKFTGVV